MKSLSELEVIRDRMQDEIAIRSGKGDIHIVVGMGTCGIEAGARDVLNAFVEGIEKEGLRNTVTVTQEACEGKCEMEPIVTVAEKSGRNTKYVKMTAEKALRVIAEHVKGGKPVADYMA